MIQPTRNANPAAGICARHTLLDGIMPTFDFRNHHALVVPAPPTCVSDAIDTARLDTSPIVKFLFRLRGLQARHGTLRQAFASEGFHILAESAGEEVVVGVMGRFWALHEEANLTAPKDASAFVAYSEPGCAKAAMNVRFEPIGAATTRLTTETRVKCIDGDAYRHFAIYWLLIKPFSGLIRREMLRAIRDAAVSSRQ